MNNNRLRVMTWNVADALGDPERATRVASVIAELDPDIAIMPQGTREAEAVDSAAVKILRNNVGTVYRKNNDDSDGRVDRHALVVAARPELIAPRVLQGLGRSAILFDLGDVEILGMHGLDRHDSRSWSNDPEIARSVQMEEYLKEMRLGSGTLSVVLGTLNDMHRDDRIAKLLRVARWGADMLPSENPGISQNRLERFGSLSQRLASYAEGASVGILERNGFQDVDPEHAPTMSMGPLHVQLDHVMVRNGDGTMDRSTNSVAESGHKPVVAEIRL